MFLELHRLGESDSGVQKGGKSVRLNHLDGSKPEEVTHLEGALNNIYNRD